MQNTFFLKVQAPIPFLDKGSEITVCLIYFSTSCHVKSPQEIN